MIQLQGVHCELGGKLVLANMSLQVTREDFLGIVGPNGAGKTTLLRLISGTAPISGGRVTIAGHAVQNYPQRQLARLLAVVPQAVAASYPFTAFEVVLMGRHPWIGRFASERREDLAQTEEAMTLTDTWHLRDRPITRISGGELQRVTIAQALAQDTPMLLLDEPTAHLDINHQLQILDIITRLYRERQKGIIFISHDLNIAARYCHRLLLLDDGRVVAEGSVAEVLTSENIRRVYGLHALVRRHPITDCIYTLPVSSEEALETAAGQGRVHVVGGGGSGSFLLRLLHEKGFAVSIGVVNVLDADLEAASLYDIPAIVEAPFSPITEESYRRSVALMRESCAVVIAETPFGAGNLRNLQAAAEAQAGGSCSVVLMNRVPIEERDYAEGKATRLFHLLQKQGAHLAASLDEAQHILARVCLQASGSKREPG